MSTPEPALSTEEVRLLSQRERKTVDKRLGRALAPKPAPIVVVVLWATSPTRVGAVYWTQGVNGGWTWACAQGRVNVLPSQPRACPWISPWREAVCLSGTEAQQRAELGRLRRTRLAEYWTPPALATTPPAALAERTVQTNVIAFPRRDEFSSVDEPSERHTLEL